MALHMMSAEQLRELLAKLNGSAASDEGVDASPS